MRVLITGADGFVGGHLARYLRDAGDEVVAIAGPHGPTGVEKLDVTDAAATRETIAAHRPDGIIHLAGFSSVGKSHQTPGLAFQVNAVGTVNVLAAVREAKLSATRTVVVSSGEVYGPVSPGTAAREDHPVVATSPYSASKIAAEIGARQFHTSYGQHVVIARPFNHLGANQDPTFVIPSFAKQIRELKKSGAAPVLRTGNLEAIRDFSHVDDVCAAYRLLLEKGAVGETYNVGSGIGRTIRSVLDDLLSVADFDVTVELDPERLRPADIPSLIADVSKLRALGWAPKKTVRDAVADAYAT